jgi:predicted GNAT family acetyltransferase
MSEVIDNPKLHRYEISFEGKTAFSEYKLADGVITFMHTEVPNEFRGKGIGSKLVRGELEAVRARGLKVVALCPFVKRYVDEHPEFQDLRAESSARRAG